MLEKDGQGWPSGAALAMNSSPFTVVAVEMLVPGGSSGIPQLRTMSLDDGRRMQPVVSPWMIYVGEEGALLG